MKNDQRSPFIIAGPCSAESKEQVLATANELSKLGQVDYFRAGIWKPRTRPNTFEGIGAYGLSWLQEVKTATGLKTCTEVAKAEHVELALKHNIDALWLGARTTVNPFSVQEICEALRGVHIPIMVKNPINPDLSLWLGAIERLEVVGIKNISAIFRGFSTYESDSRYRNKPIWRIPVELKRRCPTIPMICDPSHITGNRDLVMEVSQKAMDLNFDGLMVETHPTPAEAWSDAAQQVSPPQLSSILNNLKYSRESSHNLDFDLELEKWRQSIDQIDKDILASLSERMKIIELIGNKKREHGVTALQLQRMDMMLKERVKQAKALGLSEDLAQDIYHLIHEKSVKRQLDLMQ